MGTWKCDVPWKAGFADPNAFAQTNHFTEFGFALKTQRVCVGKPNFLDIVLEVKRT
jgi:hypothetical protein